MSKTRITMVATAVAVAAALGIGSSSAQQPGFKRQMVQKQELSVKDRDAVQAIAEFAPGVSAGRHTHPGEELSYVMEGTLILEIDGRPPVTLKAGDSFFVPAGLVHDGKNVGNGPLKVFATYIVERGKPVASPAK